MKRLLYLASGAYESAYQELPFDRLYFVDANRKLKESFRFASKHHRFLASDALLAVDYLIRKQLKIDCLVVVNEGLFEGSGHYPMFSDFLMGYLSPILKDDFLLITDLHPYRTTSYKALTKLDWGVQIKEELFPGHPNYIAPSIFTQQNTNNTDFGQVFSMKKIKKQIPLAEVNTTVKVSITHGSIWEDAEDLDFIGLNLKSAMALSSPPSNKSKTTSAFFLTNPKVRDIRGFSLEEVLKQALEQTASTIGLVPWGCSDYSVILPFLSQLENSSIKEIRFYHLNANDFSAIYEGYADWIMQRYPGFFTQFSNNNHLRLNFYKVIKKGCGETIIKLCELIAFYSEQEKESFNFSEIKWKANELSVSSRTPNQYIRGLIRMSEEMGSRSGFK